jgi:hypothetical protein
VWISLYRILSFLVCKKKSGEQPPLTPVSVEDPTALFVRLHTERFFAILEKHESKWGNWNANIDAVFYQKTVYDKEMQDEDNALEERWRRRLITLYTPRGNVVMYYHPYKMGFMYFADRSLPYDVLNAVSMRYCDMYRCIDFFMDEWILDSRYENPLLESHEKANVALPKRTVGPHTSYKQAKLPSLEERRRNRFVYGGNIRNVELMQKAPPPPPLGLQKDKEEMDARLGGNGCQKTYLDYKKSRLAGMDKKL